MKASITLMTMADQASCGGSRLGISFGDGLLPWPIKEEPLTRPLLFAFWSHLRACLFRQSTFFYNHLPHTNGNVINNIHTLYNAGASMKRQPSSAKHFLTFSLNRRCILRSSVCVKQSEKPTNLKKLQGSLSHYFNCVNCFTDFQQQITLNLDNKHFFRKQRLINSFEQTVSLNFNSRLHQNIGKHF